MNPPSVIFQKVEKKKSFFFLLFYPPSQYISCFIEKNNIFLMFSLCIFEIDTKIMKYLKI